MTSFRYQHPVTLHCQYFPPEDTRKNALQLSRHVNQRNMLNGKLLSRQPPIHRQHNENSTHIDDAPLSSGRSVCRSEGADVEEGIGTQTVRTYTHKKERRAADGAPLRRCEPPPPAADSASKGEKTLLPRLPSQPKARKYFPFPLPSVWSGFLALLWCVQLVCLDPFSFTGARCSFTFSKREGTSPFPFPNP